MFSRTRRNRTKEIAVIGLGRFGASLARALVENNYNVLGIDQDAQRVQHLSDELTHVAILDSTDEAALREIDISAFETVVVAIGADFESNVLTTATLKNLGIPFVISKAVTRRQRDILLRVGADRVVQPEYDAGRRLAEEMVAPSVLERVHLGPEHAVAEIVVPNSLTSRTLAQIDLRGRMGITVLLIKRNDHLIVSPPADTILLAGDLLLVLGSNDELLAFSNLP